MAADASAARNAARPALTWIGDPDWSAHIAPLPFADEFAALRTAATAREGCAHSLPDEWVDQLAVVGTTASARIRVEQLHDAGAHSVVLITTGSDAFASA